MIAMNQRRVISLDLEFHHDSKYRVMSLFVNYDCILITNIPKKSQILASLPPGGMQTYLRLRNPRRSVVCIEQTRTKRVPRYGSECTGCTDQRSMRCRYPAPIPATGSSSARPQITSSWLRTNRRTLSRPHEIRPHRLSSRRSSVPDGESRALLRERRGIRGSIAG